MAKLRLIFLFILISFSASSQRHVEYADSLLLNAAYNDAIDYINKHSSVAQDENILLLNKKAEAMIHLGKLDDALNVLQQVEKNQLSEFQQSIILSTKGFLLLNLGRNDLAQETLNQAIRGFENSGNQSSLEAAQALAYLGQVYKSTGKDSQAEEQLQMALRLRSNKLPADHELIAASYNDLGLAYAQIDNDLALDYYEKALVIYEKLHGTNHPKIALTNINMGIIYSMMKLYGDAVNNFESALKIWENVYPNAHQTKAFALYNLGDTYGAMGDNKAAKEYYERALDMFKKSYGNKHPEVARILYVLGNHELKGNQYNKAIAFYQQALIANVSDFNVEDETINPRLDKYYHGNVLLYSLHYKAQAFEARYFGKTLKFKDLDLALQTLQVCDTLIDKLRQQITTESDKIALGVTASEVYADGVRIAYDAAQVSLHKKPYLELAFYFAEKSKSAVLLEAISESDAKSFAGIPSELLEEEKSLKSAIALTSQKLRQKPSEEEERYLRETYFQLNRSYESFIKKLETQFPQYYNLKFNASSPSVQQVQQLLNSNEAMLSYFIDEKNKKLYIFTITKSGLEIIEHKLPANFDKFITGLRNSLYSNEMQTYSMVATSLARLLIPKLTKSITDLIILPTGRLSIIPFEALLSSRHTDITDPKVLPYLIKRYNIRYEFSAGLSIQKSKQKILEAQSILLCAPVTFPQTQQLNTLPATESEVKEISGLFAGKNLSNTLFIGHEANEDLIKTSNLKDYSYLHFATHGIVDETNPELSRIFLQPQSDAEDGNLYASEIYNLELNANLVTLSACQTGLGKISKGEGVIGLSRALVYAGAKNVIVSFWSVADESTSLLMKAFYRRLLDDSRHDFSKNLREAKLSLLNHEQYAAPYYWAPFVLIGF